MTVLVFGDRVRARDPRRLVEDIQAALVAPRKPGVEAHAAIVGVLVAAGELAQGLADAERAARGADASDGPGGAGEAAMAIVCALATCVASSWEGAAYDLEPVRAAATVLASMKLPESIELRETDGYAHYAVYPEAYMAAARGTPAGAVIGIRSIGTGLAAMVAAASGGEVMTVRPHGHREVTVAPAWLEAWKRAPHISIVDEGPGQSGSSFCAVLDLLEKQGIPLDRITCFPSHAGPLGSGAQDRDRERWQHVTRKVVTVDELLIESGKLAAWIGDLVGPLVGPLEDISAGAWRAHTTERPPVIAWQERRKFLVRSLTTTYVAKFVGHGARGEHALSRARALAAAGFTPEVAGLVHGFLVEKWLDKRQPLSALDRRKFVDHVGRYLGFRARTFPAEQGASLEQLAEMVRRNSEVALGTAVALVVPREARTRPIEIDGRLHPWEWLALPGGTACKTDAIDHHAGHDLVGCQDVAWDIAGAEVELGLSSAELARVIAIVEDVGGAPIDRELLAFLRPCYLAFQLGRHALGVGAAAAADTERLRVAADHYAVRLRVAVATYRR